MNDQPLSIQIGMECPTCLRWRVMTVWEVMHDPQTNEIVYAKLECPFCGEVFDDYK